MYRVVRMEPGGGFTVMTRSAVYNGLYYVPVFTDRPQDRRINEYGTRWGALKAMARLMRMHMRVLVVDSSTGVEIPESMEVRKNAEG